MSGDDALIGPVAPPELSVMSLNIRRARQRSRDWQRRRPRIDTLLRRERPTILGLQEALPGQVSDVRAALGADYRAVGGGRGADGGGEGCPLLFDATRLEPLSWRQLPLSPRPDVPGSRGWGAAFPRILVRVELRDRADGTVFTVLNTHLDVLSPLARRRGAELIAAATPPGPAVLTGDLNEGPGGPAWRALARRGLRDTWGSAEVQLTRTHGTYGGRAATSRAGRRIDVIAARGWQVAQVGIDARPVAGGRPSDHAAVLAVLRTERHG